MLRAPRDGANLVAISRPTSAIAAFLARVRGLLFRHEARRAAQLAVAALAALGVIIPLLAALLVGSRATAVAVLGLGGLAAAIIVGTAFVLGWIVPRRRFSSDGALARWVGTRRRGLASDLLSAVELAHAPTRPGAPSPALVDALITATAARLDALEPHALMPHAEQRRATRWMLAAVAFHALTLVVVSGPMLRGWRVLLAPPRPPFDGAQLSTVPLVGDLEATLTFPAYAKRPPLPLPSSSGDVRGLPGTKVDLHARVLAPAIEVEVVLDGETPADKPRVIPATLIGDLVTVQLTIDKSTHYRFAVRSPAGVRSFETTPRAIEAEPDLAPAVQLLAPADTLDVTNLRRVELAYMIEDDFGIASVELVWESGKDRGKKPVLLEPGVRGRAQGKVLWDIAEVVVPSGGEVRYWLEAKDTDDVGGPNIGRSKELRLRVVSPRERHEETLGRHQEVAEKLVKNLGGRLTLPTEEAAPREELARQLREAIVELGSISAAFDKDPHASDALRKDLGHIRERLDKLATTEAKLLPRAGTRPPPPGRFTLIDPRLIGELEDDVIALADWLDRERLEGMLDVTDEITAHQKRVADLMAQYEKTKDPRLLEEIERELKALERSYAELDKQRRGMAEDVLDQYVNRDALETQEGASCLAEVRELVRAGQHAQAAAKLESCRVQHDRSASSLEGSLAGLRGDKFSEEQKKLDEVMNELADVAKDQDDIAAEANRIFEAYAQKADEVAKDKRREASKKVGALVERLRKRLEDVEESGLTPFAKEELDIVQRRIGDVEQMVADGDLAEALAMARQARTSLETIAGELEAAISDDPKSRWADVTQEALEGIEHTEPVIGELIRELQALSPRPDQIMSPDDLRALDRLRRREAMNKARAGKLAERTKQLGPELPGDTGAELGKKLGGALDQMGKADERMKAKDPSGARETTRAAAEALAKARDRARSAARQAQEGAVSDEPIRIPGADEYRAPERFREDLLEAMKKKDRKATPDGYDDMIDRYYKELIK